MDQIDFAGYIKRKRLSKRRFAKIIDVEYKNVFRMFKPTYNPLFSHLASIADRLNCHVDELIKQNKLRRTRKRS